MADAFVGKIGHQLKYANAEEAELPHERRRARVEASAFIMYSMTGNPRIRSVDAQPVFGVGYFIGPNQAIITLDSFETEGLPQAAPQKGHTIFASCRGEQAMRGLLFLLRLFHCRAVM